MNKILHRISNPVASDHMDIIGPDGVKVVRKAKPENPEYFLNNILHRYKYDYIKVIHYVPNGTSRRKIGEYIWDGTSLKSTTSHSQSQKQHTFHDTLNMIPSPYAPYPPYPGMQAPFPGLNDPVHRSALVKIELYDQVKQERDQYRKLFEECKDRADKLQKELDLREIQEKLKEENKSTEILQTILSTAIEHYTKKKEITPGMNAPQNPVLNEICRTLGHMDPSVLPEFNAIVVRMINDPDFLSEIRMVEEKFGLIKKKNNEQGSHRNT